MNRLSGTIAVVAVLTVGLILAASAGAAPIYTCGFEPSEGFAPGNLNGQGGWFGPVASPTVVEAGQAYDGVQAVQATANGSYREGYVSWKMGTPAVATSEPEVIVSQRIMITHVNEADWLLVLWDETKNSVLVWFTYEGNILVGAGESGRDTGANWEAGLWYNVKFALDYSSATFDVYVDENLIAENEAMTAASSLAQLDVFCDEYISSEPASLYYDSLVVSLPPGLGDANDDGVVDDADASILGAHWHQTSGANWEDGDFNNDHAVDDKDAAILAMHWTFDPGEGNGTVPEPSAPVLLLGAATAWLARPRRRCHRAG
ncbi:MAG: dockerin type I domain-containing protein [Planctomycetia bacterium]|nr:dockerin type I domain-containing protein [Planctomycetia bacterium]